MGANQIPGRLSHSSRVLNMKCAPFCILTSDGSMPAQRYGMKTTPSKSNHSPHVPLRFSHRSRLSYVPSALFAPTTPRPFPPVPSLFYLLSLPFFLLAIRRRTEPLVQRALKTRNKLLALFARSGRRLSCNRPITGLNVTPGRAGPAPAARLKGLNGPP